MNVNSFLNLNIIKQFPSHFTNANELRLTADFDLPRDSIVDSLNRIIPLRQLTRLIIQCDRVPFGTFVELLHSTPFIFTY